MPSMAFYMQNVARVAFIQSHSYGKELLKHVHMYSMHEQCAKYADIVRLVR